ncbi:MAG: hypothetical protein JWN99_384 [Ilumatobacteraceae bacterium]|nr:hypothetical protein [Ilumatobacteraceae bacterium]
MKDVERQHGTVQKHLASAHAAAIKRADSINEALSLGATLRSLGEALEVSPETVRKMAGVSQ